MVAVESTTVLLESPKDGVTGESVVVGAPVPAAFTPATDTE